MQLTYHDKDYDVVIEKKLSNCNTYIRVKKDLKVHITTNLFTTMYEIEKLVRDNYSKICKMIDFQETKVKNNTGFFYLGKQYVIVYTDFHKVSFENDKVFVPHDFDSNLWYKKQAKSLFQERFDYNYHRFTKKVPYPRLRIRKMTTRWGVCNTRDKIITLNLELIKRDIC